MNTEDQLDPAIAGFVKPPIEFCGQKLNAYGPGWKVLFHQATASNDGVRNSGTWVSVALLYLLSLPRIEAQQQAFNRPEFREKALAWFEKIGGNADEATKLAEEILTQAEQTKVEVADGGTDPKNA